MILEIGIAAIMFFLGVYVVYEASTYPDFSKLTAVGSDVFPKIMGGIIIICSLIVILRAAYKLLISPQKNQNLEAERAMLREIKQRFLDNKQNLPAAIGLPVMMIIYAFLLEIVGFEILSVLFLLFSMLLCRERNILRLILVPLVGTAFMYYIFHILLKIMLPMAFF